MEIKRTITVACDYCGKEMTFEIDPASFSWDGEIIKNRSFAVGDHFTGTLFGHCCGACFTRIDRDLTSNIVWHRNGQ